MPHIRASREAALEYSLQRKPWGSASKIQRPDRGGRKSGWRSMRCTPPRISPLMSIVIFTQPGCFSCELMRVYLEAREIAFEERDISKDTEARRTMTETYGSNETPTMLIDEEVIIGFDPGLLDQILDSPASSDSVN